MALLDAPNVFGHTIFCDDIRDEVGGKVTFVGVYTSNIFVHVPFPATLPVFAFGITLFQKRSVFVPNIGLRVFLPGDPDDAASIQAELGEKQVGAIEAQLSANRNFLHPDALAPVEANSYPTLRANLKFQQLHLKQPGIMRVRAVIGDDMVRLGSIGVSPAPQSS
jgi:hypothetical protein